MKFNNPKYKKLYICFNNKINKFYFSINKKKYNSNNNWTIDNNILKNSITNQYLACDFNNYRLYLSNDLNHAMVINNKNGYLYYIKNDIRITFDITNYYKYNYNNINVIKIIVLLAGGNSTRFNINNNNDYCYKQLYKINDKPILLHLVELFSKLFDIIIIVTNNKCYNLINDLCKNNIILINDIDSRLESINVAFTYIYKYYYKNNENIKVLIHDVARPFIPIEYITNIINSKYHYNQYCLKLVNGLFINNNNNNYCSTDRDKYVESCTPIYGTFYLLYYILNNYMNIGRGRGKNMSNEFIDILNLLDIKYNFIYGCYKYLKKITTIDDI